MKLYRVMKEHKLRQTVFYNWLREAGLIQKADTGYVIGENALPGMATITSLEQAPDGSVLREQTQVVIEDEEIPELLALYAKSGLSNLYQEEDRQVKPDQIKEQLHYLTKLVLAVQEEVHQIAKRLEKS